MPFPPTSPAIGTSRQAHCLLPPLGHLLLLPHCGAVQADLAELCAPVSTEHILLDMGRNMTHVHGICGHWQLHCWVWVAGQDTLDTFYSTETADKEF